MKRKYYNDINYKPNIYYVIFGVSLQDMVVSQTKHKVNELPADIAIRALTRKENGDFIDSFFQGAMGEMLLEKNETLFMNCKDTETCVVIHGSIRNDSTFDYMRNIIGIIQAFVEHGAVGVLDVLTITLHSPSEWTKLFFNRDVDARAHVVIYCSKEGEGFWIHTRGLAKFGRPDIGMHDVPKEKVDDYIKIIQQMIYYEGQGLFLEGPTWFHTADEKRYLVHPQFVKDFDNEDYNNAYINATVTEE